MHFIFRNVKFDRGKKKIKSVAGLKIFSKNKFLTQFFFKKQEEEAIRISDPEWWETTSREQEKTAEQKEPLPLYFPFKPRDSDFLTRRILYAAFVGITQCGNFVSMEGNHCSFLERGKPVCNRPGVLDIFNQRVPACADHFAAFDLRKAIDERALNFNAMREAIHKCVQCGPAKTKLYQLPCVHDMCFDCLKSLSSFLSLVCPACHANFSLAQLNFSM